MLASSQDFWALFFDTFDKGALEPAFISGWHQMLADDRPGLAGVLQHIAAHLQLKPRQLRKMSDKRRAALLLPKLGDITFLLPYVTDTHYRGRRGPSVGRFLDLMDVPHDRYNIVPSGVALPSAAALCDSVAVCLAEQRSMLAIYRYLTVQSTLVVDWRHRARPAIEYIAAHCPDLASTFDDDIVTPAEPSSATRQRQHVADLEAALDAAIRADRFSAATEQAAHTLLAERSEHGRASRAIGRILARRGVTYPYDSAPSITSGDWIWVAYLDDSHRRETAAVFKARAESGAARLHELAGRGREPAQWLAARRLGALWHAGQGESVERLLGSAYSTLGRAEAWRALDWSAEAGRAGHTDLEQRLLQRLARHTQTVAGMPIGGFGRAVTLALARAYHRVGAHVQAQSEYSRFLAVYNNELVCWQALLNRLEAIDIDGLAKRLASHPTGDGELQAELAHHRDVLLRLAQSCAAEAAGPAAYLLACAHGHPIQAGPLPTQQTAARLAAACRQARASGQANALWAAHARYLHRVVAYRRERSPPEPLTWQTVAPLVGHLPVTNWHGLLDLADRQDPAGAQAMLDGLIANDIELPWPVAAGPHYLARGEAARRAWQRQAGLPTTGLRRAIAIECALFAAYRDAGDSHGARDVLDRIERLAESPSGAAIVAAWLDAGAELSPAWSSRSRLWFRLCLAQRTGDTVNLPAIVTALFFEIHNTEPFAAGELAALARRWGAPATADRLTAALTARDASTGCDTGDDSPVSVVFVGGNEIQARCDAPVRARLSQEGVNVSVVFHHVGWDGNWARRIDILLAECNGADAVVLMPYMRTHFGRALRAGLSQPWVACPGTGREAMIRSIYEATRVARGHRQRHASLPAAQRVDAGG